MSTSHIALVPEVGTNLSGLASVSAALQKQVTRDLAPIWNVSATVDAFPCLEEVPPGYWPIILTFRSLGNAEGIHVDREGQPFAIIEFSPSWSLTASHVCLEMITDPTGNGTLRGPSPRLEQGDVEFLWGICDPCAHADYAYFVNDVLVSDFYTPAFWEASSRGPDRGGARRSFTGAIRRSRDVLPGGHLAWYDPVSNCWWFRQNVDHRVGDVRVTSPGPTHGVVRELVAGQVAHLRSTRIGRAGFEARTEVQHESAARASQSRAGRWRAVLSVAGRAQRSDGRARPVPSPASRPERTEAAFPSESRALAALAEACKAVAAHDDEEPTLQHRPGSPFPLPRRRPPPLRPAPVRAQPVAASPMQGLPGPTDGPGTPSSGPASVSPWSPPTTEPRAPPPLPSSSRH